MFHAVKVLDHGYVRFVEDWGRGDAGEPEAGIIEAARQSTQGSFRGWEDKECTACGAVILHGELMGVTIVKTEDGKYEKCPTCDGKGFLPGDQRLLKFLYSGKPQHATPFEFCGMVIEVQAPIFVYREWHRHRTQSYNEMSARYAPLPDLNYMPTIERLMLNQGTKNKQAAAVKGAAECTEVTARNFRTEVEACYKDQEAVYQSYLKMGVPKELTRIVLPVGRYSRMRACTNLRNWLAFMTLRADPAAQWEIQQFAREVGNVLAARFPRTWALYVEGCGK